MGSIINWKFVGKMVTGLAAALAIGMALTLILIPRVVGGAALTVLSGSMTPAYPVGSVIVVRPVEATEVKAGDVITYAERGGSFTTHRVTNVTTDVDGSLEFTTKGDANPGEDTDPVVEEALRGRVWFHVPLLGHARDAVSSPLGIGSILSAVALALSWDRVRTLVRRFSRGRRSALSVDSTQDLPPVPQNGDALLIADTSAGAALAPTPGPATAILTAASDDAHFEPIEPSDVTVDLRPTARVEQQLMLARLNAGTFARGKVIELLGLVRGHVVSIGASHMVVSITGTPEHLDGVEHLLRAYGLVEASRSAVVHVGSESPVEGHFPRLPEAVADSVRQRGSLDLRPPAPPRFALTHASRNGQTHESSNQ